jgi:Bacterial Ig-like domain (group 2)
MFNRFCLGALLLAGLAVPLTGCSNASSGLDSISISPSASQQLVVGNPANDTVQLTATGTFGNGKHPSSGPVSGVTWTSSTGAASVSSTGLVSAVTAGSATITASAQGFNGPVSASVQVTVTAGTTVTTGGDVISLTLIPSAQSVASPGDTSQFQVFGTTKSGSTLNLTSNTSLAWSSSAASVGVFCTAAATPSSLCTSSDLVSGLVMGIGQGQTSITASYTNTADGTSAVGTATFTVISGGGTAAAAVTAITIYPGSQSLSEDQQGNFVAIGTTSTSTSVDLTGLVDWASSVPSIATISTFADPTSTCTSATPAVCVTNPDGLVTGLNPGAASITAEYTVAKTNPPTVVEAAPAAVTVTNTPPPEPMLSLTIIPNALTVNNLQGSGQFLAIGTFSTPPYVRDMTDSVTWISSFPNIFPVDTNSGGNVGASAGIVTAYGNGGATIIAEATAKDGSVQTATATFSCPLVMPCPCSVAQGCSTAITVCPAPVAGSCFPTSEASALLSTVTVYNEGVNNTNWLVTAPSATGTANVVHCGPGWAAEGNTTGSVCVGTYPTNTGTPVIFTATQTPGSTGTFGGWSWNCTPVKSPTDLTITAISATGPNYCALNPTAFNETVGAIFN